MSDAIAIAVMGNSEKFGDHKQAAKALTKICSKHEVDPSGVGHLSWLLQNKTDIAYGDRRLDEAFIQTAVLKAQRFNAWAYNMFKEVLRVQETA